MAFSFAKSMAKSPGFHFDRALETIEDAVSKLRERCPYFAHHGGATVKVIVLGQPDGRELPSVALVGPLDASQKRWAIGMAFADGFKARTAIEHDWQKYAIERLDEAQVDQDANVTLADGRNLFDVRLMTRPVPADLTDAERLAVRAIIGCETGSPYVDYAALPDLGNVPLKMLRERIELYRRRESTVPALSWEVYRSALVKTGMRRPSRRR